jgi:3-hydroxyacyl-CoA dehydrogenase
MSSRWFETAMNATPNIAIIGAGLIGRSWAIVFARARHRVAIYDADPAALRASADAIAASLRDLQAIGLLEEDPPTVQSRMRIAASLAECLDGAGFLQENIAESLAAKRALFAEAEVLAAPEAIFASSTSTIPASQWSESLASRARCIVAHPVNPPHLVPLVELSPAAWTSPETVESAKAIYEGAGQVPIVVRNEIQGFILNRLQGALLAEAFRLYADGYASTEDIDKTVREGLGLRWSFMGPFETIDLNAPGGVVDYCARYGALYEQMAQTQLPRRWDADLVRHIERERRERLPTSQLAARSAWRDRRLMQLIAHKRRAQETD